MRLNRNIITILILGSLLYGCIDPYNPGDLKFENMLFIEAQITDDPDIIPYVKLSHAYPFNQDYEVEKPLVSIYGAIVSIENDQGKKAFFQSGAVGGFIGDPHLSSSYRLKDPGFKLEEGRSYMLRIETTDGYIFESQFEKYLPSPVIEEISYSFSTWEKPESSTEDEGYRFYVSTASQDNDPLFLRWNIDATFKYMVPFIGYYIWDGESLIDANSNNLNVCYKDEIIKGIFTGTSDGLTVNRVDNEPLHTVSRFGDRLQINYSLHVRQMRIPVSAYNFWNDLQSLLYKSGGLYESIPYRLTGNIECISHDNLSVAGVFEVASVTETRIFVPRPTDFYIITNRCIAAIVGTSEHPWRSVAPGSWIMEGDPEDYFTAPLACFDCREKGGYLKQPAFWEN